MLYAESVEAKCMLCMYGHIAIIKNQDVNVSAIASVLEYLRPLRYPASTVAAAA